MPNRVITEATWASRKIRTINPPEFRPEYAWLRPVVMDNGIFELDAEAIFAKAYAVARPGWSPEKVEQLLDEFIRVKLIMPFDAEGKKWAYWAGDWEEGHLPSPTRRFKPAPVDAPTEQLKAFFGPAYRDVSATLAQGKRDANTGQGFGQGQGHGNGEGNGTGSSTAAGASASSAVDGFSVSGSSSGSSSVKSQRGTSSPRPRAQEPSRDDTADELGVVAYVKENLSSCLDFWMANKSSYWREHPPQEPAQLRKAEKQFVKYISKAPSKKQLAFAEEAIRWCADKEQREADEEPVTVSEAFSFTEDEEL